MLKLGKYVRNQLIKFNFENKLSSMLKMFLKPKNIVLIHMQCRWKSGKQRWAIEQRKQSRTDRALENFDDFYQSVYGDRWRNMRVALLTQHKYVALVNNFGDTEKTCSTLELDGAINIRSLVELSKEKSQKNHKKFSASKTDSNVDEKLQQIVKLRQEREKHALYPNNEIDLPEHIEYGQKENDLNTNMVKSSSDNTLNAAVVDGKKSLQQAIDEDSYLDSKRLVDPGVSTGGLYEYLPANKIKGMEDWIPESDHYKYYQATEDFPLKIIDDTEFSLPENLNIYTYEMGNCSEYKSPNRCLTGVFSHFLMDGASILPPLFLDVKHGERVLDACAAPGGKSLLLLQTLYPGILVCNDVQESRINRLRRVMQDFLFDFRERWENKRLLLSQSDARNLQNYELYDKILVDVPCTTDRHSVTEEDNNIFKPTRIKERLRLPELQAGILTNCLRLLRPGGTLVYSTCSLSPVQNDGVVHMALQRAFAEHGITTTIKDLRKKVQYFREIFKFEQSKNLKYGQMVVPYLPANFGPMYFSKITRNL